jgi:hypothetical protein
MLSISAASEGSAMVCAESGETTITNRNNFSKFEKNVFIEAPDQNLSRFSFRVQSQEQIYTSSSFVITACDMILPAQGG